MMRWVVETSVKLRILVVAIAVGVMVVGVMQIHRMPVDVLPEFAPPTVEIQTEALGLSAPEVEQMVTVPMEQDLLNGVAWLDAIHSESVTGLSRIQLIFEPGTDLMRARQVVQERLTQAHALPNVSSPPQMIDPLSSTGRVMIIRFSSDTVNPIQMSVLARWVVKPRLLGVNGVANVSIFGQRERQIQVLVDPQQLRSRNVTLLDVITTAGNALWVSPLSFLEASTPGTGGFIDTPNQRLSIQHLLPIKKASDLAQAPMAASGDTQLLRLGDVASVVEDHQPLIGDAISDAGVNDLLFVIEKAPDANVRDVTAGIEAALTALGPGLNGVSIDRSLYRPASYLDAAMANLAPALLAGAVLLVLALGAALWDWRAAAIGAATIPLALVAATFVLALRGLTFNAMLLVGLVVALGAIVGDVAADVAAVRRRLRPRPDEATLSVGEAVHAAAQETRGPAVYGALILLLALVPTFLVAFLGGVPSALFGPIAQAYALALAASLAIALTLTPALAWFLYAWFPVGQGAAPGAQLRAAYHRLVAALAMRPGWSWVLLAAFIAAGVLAAPFLRTAMTPTFQDRDLLIHWEGAPGVSLPEMSRITTLATQELRSTPGVLDVGAHVGRALMSDQSIDVNGGEIWVALDPKADYDATVDAVRAVVGGYPGIRSDVLTYPTERERALLGQGSDTVVARLYGQDFDILTAKAGEIQQRMAKIDGIVEPHIIAPYQQEPTLQVEVDLAKAQQYGVSPGEVRRAAAALLSGVSVGNLFDDQKVFEVVVRGAPGIRVSPSGVRELLIDTPDGGHVRLGDVATVALAPMPADIRHDSVLRYVDIGAGLRGRDIGAVTTDLTASLATMDMPLEYHAEVLGGFAQRQGMERQLLAMSIAALVGMFLLLQAAFNSWKLAGLAFLALPGAVAGGVVAIALGGGVLSLGALAGLLAIFAIAARDVVFQIRRLQCGDAERGQTLDPVRALAAAADGLAPTLATALATGLALTPLALLGPVAGNELTRPLALAAFGGLVTATLVNLLVVPTLYPSLAPTPEPATALEPPALGPAIGPALQ